jgi:hypothetical protein
VQKKVLWNSEQRENQGCDNEAENERGNSASRVPVTPLNMLSSRFPQVWKSCSCADAEQDSDEGYGYRVKAYRFLFTLQKSFKLEA